jgi:Kef-type K+ transport system membrane component KefB
MKSLGKHLSTACVVALVGLVFVSGNAIAFGIWHPLGLLVSILISLGAILLMTIAAIRCRKIDDEEMMRREDKAMKAFRL